MQAPFQYALEHFTYKRIPSREVYIGDVPLGAHHPIRIQSMTTTDTMDTIGTVEQSIRMIEAGCEYVRITAPSKKEAQNLSEIKRELRKRGYPTPLVADIHFTPNAAEIAARIVEKVRVNPGNYADKKRFKELDFTDESYQAELDRIYERFSPLVKICKEEGTAMRIGTNHGSLSDRVMSRYGDTPLGMVESAMEFIRICEDHNFYDIVISMKASNPQVMVQAYRLLMEQMLERDQVYPLHLGVTEAGEGEDGRVKSALGIATLLLDGIGDTVRVSLTEEPEYEMPVGQFLVDQIVKKANSLTESVSNSQQPNTTLVPFNPYSFERRHTYQLLNIGGEEVPRVIADVRHFPKDPSSLSTIGYTYIPALDKYTFSDIAADWVYFGTEVPPYNLPGGLKKIYDAATWQYLTDRATAFPLFSSVTEFLEATYHSEQLNFVKLDLENCQHLSALKPNAETCVFILTSHASIPTYEWRQILYKLIEFQIAQPAIVQIQAPAQYDFYSDAHLPAHLQLSYHAQTQLYLTSQVSTLLVDGLIEGLWKDHTDTTQIRAAFSMLQLSRLRITKTEYISCPSCGRTLFDLQETTAMIRSRTEHLKGVKIGIMGCIVNGPGEMADADYGYVGVGPDKIALYRGKTVVEKGVKTAEAVDRLIELIRADGKWIEPKNNAVEYPVN